MSELIVVVKQIFPVFGVKWLFHRAQRLRDATTEFCGFAVALSPQAKVDGALVEGRL